MNETHWQALDPHELLRRLDVDVDSGLTDEEARRRLEHYGPNQLPDRHRRPGWRIFVMQFSDFMILVLLLAAIVSGVVGDPVDTTAIVVILVLNALIGTVQEFRAERAIAALKAMSAPSASVRRENRESVVAAARLVPGDVVLLSAGALVPADLRLVECAELEVNESLLTGESAGVVKQCETLPKVDLPVAERTNMAFKGSQINRGRATGIVVATGLETELGRIAGLLKQAPETKTPLQRRLATFGQRLATAILGVCAVIFIVGLLRGEPVLLMLLTAISLAVAAIPEALPAVVSVSLALGARRLSRHHALVRHLPAVETLGSVTFICTDKTGTLTENRMTAECFVVGDRVIERIPEEAGELAIALAVSNDVEAEADDKSPRGEPTEIALFIAARDHGYRKQALEEKFPRVAELPFDAQRKRMSTLHRTDAGLVLFCKGAPEQVLPRCVDVDVQALLARAEELAGQGYRVLAVAERRLAALSGVLDRSVLLDAESALTFLGLVALIDPPRKEVPQAVKDCRHAGITSVMITGDHPATALAIARRLGIAESPSELVTGTELTRLSSAALQDRIRELRVYARVGPEQKIRIVEALQAVGEFSAMTGDGVNDAPALKQADIGIAMGEKGTDVAREAADMVLLDDNFATIARAVREGRRIFDNIRKFIKYTMTSNSGEIWVLFLAPFLGLPVPLLPIHILWINLVTDGLPGLALAVEPAEAGIMGRPPRPPHESVFAGGMWHHMIWVGLLIAAVSLLAQAWSWSAGSEHWQTMVFTVLTFCQLAHVMAIRAESESLISQGLFTNKALLGAVVLTICLQLMVIYIPFLNPVFRTYPLSLPELTGCFVLPLIILLAVETEKLLRRRGLIYQTD